MTAGDHNTMTVDLSLWHGIAYGLIGWRRKRAGGVINCGADWRQIKSRGIKCDKYYDIRRLRGTLGCLTAGLSNMNMHSSPVVMPATYRICLNVEISNIFKFNLNRIEAILCPSGD